VLTDSRAIVKDGQVVSGAPNVHVATINFLASGGDQYPYRGVEYITLGVTYQQAVVNYIKEGLGGSITKARYPEGGEGRIRTVGTP
jgi:5'-nucleotidase